MASMNISLPDPLRDFVQQRVDAGRYASASDYVRDLIRRDQDDTEDVERWLQALDASIEQGMADAKAGRVHDLDDACGALIKDLEQRTGQAR